MNRQEAESAVVTTGLTARRLRPADEAALAALFAEIATDPAAADFHPHPFTAAEAGRISGYPGRDLYLGLFGDDARPIGYGMLRGWDDGFEIPSLGIYLAAAGRGQGLSRLLMEALHRAAANQGATRVRLKVYRRNQKALTLYQRLGYVFGAEEAGQLVGLLDLPANGSPRPAPSVMPEASPALDVPPSSPHSTRKPPMSIRFPVYRPRFTGKEREKVLDCIDSTWISSKGKYIAEFEAKFAAFLGVDHALAVSNGTVALHVALEALGIGRGDEVLLPTLTYIASANAITYTGATPVFVDSETDYWQIDPAAIEAKITPRTRAIMPVHLYGHPCDMEAIMAIARKHKLHVIEDCAEAIGTRDNGRLVGTFGDVASFSFFGNKTITTGEGGMVTTGNADLADRISRLKGQGLARDREYWHDLVGYNYRMTNICAAIGSAQMDALAEVIELKQRLAGWYRDALADLPVAIHGVKPGSFNSYWMVSILTDEAGDRDPLRAALKAGGVETRPLFWPMHQMDIYARPGESYPRAENLASRGMNLPSYPDLSRDDVGEICSVIAAYYREGRERR